MNEKHDHRLDQACDSARIITQRRRLIKRQLNGRKTGKAAIIRLIVFTVLFILSWFLQYVLSAMIGYDSFGYKMFYYWGYWGVVLMLALISAVLLFEVIRTVRWVVLSRKFV